MESPHLNLLLLAAASFTVGLFIPSPLGGPQAEAAPEADSSQTVSRRHRAALGEKTIRSNSDRDPDKSRSHEPKKLNLPVEVVEALIKAKGMERMLPQMGLTESEVKTVIEIKTAAIKGLKDLEVKHAKLQSDEEGEFYAIEVFPEDRDLWMAEMVVKLRNLVDDDRATVISRIIAQSDNDEETGLYRREIRTFKRNPSDSDTLIKESVFNKEGQLIDNDYTIYRGEHETRWEHLFEPGK